MAKEISGGRKQRTTRAALRRGVLYSMTLLAAPAASTCGSGSGSGSNLPCDVDAVLRAKCQGCHNTTPLFGAPMSLVTYDDTQKPAVTNSAVKVWQMMQTRVHGTTSPMPPIGQTALTSTELSALDTWFSSGAPGSSPTCSNDGGVVDLNSLTGPQFLPCTPNRTVKAHAAGSTAPYPVPNPTNNSYVCFNFKSPFASGEQAIAWAPVINDARVIHHWILFGTNNAVTDGSISQNCFSTAGTHVTGWAPGGTNSVLPSDVSLNLNFSNYQLQVHYNNSQYSGAADASGVAFCTTTTPRQNVAGVVTLGNSSFSIPSGANDFAVNAQCSKLSNNNSTITVLSTSPHMHLLGTGFRTQHFRGTTNLGDLSYIPMGTWSFENQRHYQTIPRRDVLPGDILKTTCYYDNPNTFPVTFGVRTQDEMCFDFIFAYPYANATKTCMQ
jgi:hypothetical protein